MACARDLDYDRARDELRLLLREWNPIGVVSLDTDEDDGAEWPADEYDCLIPGLLRRLGDGEGEEHLAAYLTRELIDHFGLTPEPQVDRMFAEELVRWNASGRA